jgi:hypothetical protein
LFRTPEDEPVELFAEEPVPLPEDAEVPFVGASPLASLAAIADSLLLLDVADWWWASDADCWCPAADAATNDPMFDIAEE